MSVSKVLIFCVKFQELSHLTQAEKKITVVTSWATEKMTTVFTQLEISHVLNGTTPKIQHRKWGPQCLAIEKKNCLAFYLTVAYGEQQQNAWNAVTELSVETKKLYLFDQEWARGLNSDDISTVEIAISAYS